MPRNPKLNNDNPMVLRLAYEGFLYIKGFSGTERYDGLLVQELADAYNVNLKVMRRWLTEAGVNIVNSRLRGATKQLREIQEGEISAESLEAVRELYLNVQTNKKLNLTESEKNEAIIDLQESRKGKTRKITESIERVVQLYRESHNVNHVIKSVKIEFGLDISYQLVLRELLAGIARGDFHIMSDFELQQAAEARQKNPNLRTLAVELGISYPILEAELGEYDKRQEAASQLEGKAGGSDIVLPKPLAYQQTSRMLCEAFPQSAIISHHQPHRRPGLKGFIP